MRWELRPIVLALASILGAVGWGCSSSSSDDGLAIDSGSETAADDFEIRVPKPLLKVQQAGTVSLGVEAVRRTGFTAPIDVTLEGLPTGVTALPATISGADNGTLVMISAAASAALAATPITAVATSGTQRHTANAIVTVIVPLKTFQFTVTPYELTVTAGGSVMTQIKITPENGFSGTVNLSFSVGVPGITIAPASFAAPGPGPTTQDVTISCDATVAKKKHQLMLDLASPDADHGGSIAISVTVQ
jgi:hypothetical protein